MALSPDAAPDGRGHSSRLKDMLRRSRGNPLGDSPGNAESNGTSPTHHDNDGAPAVVSPARPPTASSAKPLLNASRAVGNAAPAVHSSGGVTVGGAAAMARARHSSDPPLAVVQRRAEVTVDSDGNPVVNGVTLLHQLFSYTDGRAGVVSGDGLAAAACEPTVFYGKAKDSDEPCVVKRFPRTPESAAVVREARALQQLQHPHMVAVHECVDDPALDSVYLFLQHVPGGPAAEVDDAGLCDPLPPDRVLAIAGQVSEALSFLHDRGMVHGDLKPENVLVDSDTEAALILKSGPPPRCFGTAEAFVARVAAAPKSLCAPPPSSPVGLSNSGSSSSGSGPPLAARPQSAARRSAPTLSPAPQEGQWDLGAGADTAVVGTPAFAAPEIFRGAAPTAESDMWAFGMLLYALLFGRVPFHAATLPSLEAGVKKKSPLASAVSAVVVPPGASRGAAALAEAVVLPMLVADPQQRMTAEEATMTLQEMSVGGMAPPAPSVLPAPVVN